LLLNAQQKLIKELAANPSNRLLVIDAGSGTDTMNTLRGVLGERGFVSVLEERLASTLVNSLNFASLVTLLPDERPKGEAIRLAAKVTGDLAKLTGEDDTNYGIYDLVFIRVSKN
jgi:hypothetical protein